MPPVIQSFKRSSLPQRLLGYKVLSFQFDISAHSSVLQTKDAMEGTAGGSPNTPTVAASTTQQHLLQQQQYHAQQSQQYQQQQSSQQYQQAQASQQQFQQSHQLAQQVRQQYPPASLQRAASLSVNTPSSIGHQNVPVLSLQEQQQQQAPPKAPTQTASAPGIFALDGPSVKLTYFNEALHLQALSLSDQDKRLVIEKLKNLYPTYQKLDSIIALFNMATDVAAHASKVAKLENIKRMLEKQYRDLPKGIFYLLPNIIETIQVNVTKFCTYGESLDKKPGAEVAAGTNPLPSSGTLLPQQNSLPVLSQPQKTPQAPPSGTYPHSAVTARIGQSATATPSPSKNSPIILPPRNNGVSPIPTPNNISINNGTPTGRDIVSTAGSTLVIAKKSVPRNTTEAVEYALSQDKVFRDGLKGKDASIVLSSSSTKPHDWIKELGLYGLTSTAASPSLEFSDQEDSDTGTCLVRTAWCVIKRSSTSNIEVDDFGLLFKVPPKEFEDTAMVVETLPGLGKATKHTFRSLDQEMKYLGAEGWILQRISPVQGFLSSQNDLVSAERHGTLLIIEFENDRVAACQIIRSPDGARRKLQQHLEQCRSRTLSDILRETLAIVQNEG